MKYEITSNGFPSMIAYLEKGNQMYAERNSAISFSKLYTSEDPDGVLVRRRIMSTELQGKDYIPAKKNSPLAQFWENRKVSQKQTMDRFRIAEASYILYEAIDDSVVTLRSCFPGVIMPWNTKPLDMNERYVAIGGKNKTLKTKNGGINEIDPPHGTLIAIKKSFLAAEMSVITSVYHTGDNKVKLSSETNDTFQRFSGKGMVFLEVHGDLQEKALLPGESLCIIPGYLLAFTEGVTISMKPAGDPTLRHEETSFYVIEATAGPLGGFVYTHSVRKRDFYCK